MPRKIRELKAELLRAGFSWLPAKGSHTRWSHPDAPDVRLTLSGHDGDDAQPYEERDVRRVLQKVQETKDRQA